MTNNEEQAASAYIHAVGLGMGNTIYKALRNGDRFVFCVDHADKPYAILVKHKNGYRHEIGGRLFKTGALTAVFKI